MRRHFTPAQLASYFEGIAASAAPKIELAADVTARTVETNIKRVFGDLNKLEELAPTTQAERVRQGFLPNDPLLRSGTLRESIRSEIVPGPRGPIVAVGTDDPKMMWLEFGTTRGLPARPAFQIGMNESEAEVVEIMNTTARSILTGGPPRFSKGTD